jgi:lytic murein transglycosylase
MLKTRHLLLIVTFLVLMPAAQAADAAFDTWLRSLWPEAQRLGISRKVFDEATRGLEPDLTLPDLVVPGRADKPPPGQAEFVQTPADYLNEKSLARLTEHGRTLAAAHRETLTRIEKEFGVPGPVVLAIWGRETDFGRYKLPYSALRVLATQSYLGRRKDYFRQEFLAAIKMVEDGLARPAEMKSSWGGAMGLTQFLPSEFYKHAVDFDGDGRADIFNSIPDALASAAKQLAAKGWQRGERWAYEVRAPSNFDCTQGVPEIVKPIHDWLRLGFVPSYDRKLTAAELSKEASVLQPEGALGPAFLTPKNYFVIKEYNFSDLYVLFVGQLSDRIAGERGFEQPWGKTSQMRTAQVEEMQNILTARGLYQSKIDGKAGMQTRSALGVYQKAGGLPLDCWPNTGVLDHMRKKIGHN